MLFNSKIKVKLKQIRTLFLKHSLTAILHLIQNSKRFMVGPLTWRRWKYSQDVFLFKIIIGT